MFGVANSGYPLLENTMETTEQNTLRKRAWRDSNPENRIKERDAQRKQRAINGDAINARRRERRANDPVYAEKQRARDRARTASRADSQKDYNLQKAYGITLEQYNEMLEAQNGACAICGAKQADTIRKKLSVDHCHDEGHVRGLLCTHCNMGIGQMKHDIDLLKKAIHYLEAI